MSITAPGNSKSAEMNLDVERAVLERYSAAARVVEPALCCPVAHDPNQFDFLPRELIERDYGCGDPSRHVAPGETVLDLGSGGGKICYIASQVVGPAGRVIGVDMNDDMLALARQYQAEIGRRIGWHNVEFHKGRIQDLALDLDQFNEVLRSSPIVDADGWLRAQALADEMRRDRPLIANDSVDVVISSCVLNLVRSADRRQLFQEIHRVLRRGGRAVISDIVCDEPVPQHLRDDPNLWSGCVSGAYVEHEFIEAFEQAGFYGIEILDRQVVPWAVVEGIEFRSQTVRAYKGKEGPCFDHLQAVIYTGPWRSVTDDDGHVLRRGVRSAVCEKTYRIYTSAPYAGQFAAVPPAHAVSPADAAPFDCRRDAVRDPAETKNSGPVPPQLPLADCCPPPKCC